MINECVQGGIADTLTKDALSSLETCQDEPRNMPKRNAIDGLSQLERCPIANTTLPSTISAP